MKKIIVLFFSCSIHWLQAQSQIIEGTVYDAKTRETVPGVVIYFNGTSINTTTDRDGYFKLSMEQMINTKLIFSHLSYEPLTFEPPFNRLPKTFFLKEKVAALQAVLVVADRVSMEEKMKMFRAHFLGKSEAGKSCVILNEEDIMLRYDMVANTLHASANKPIIIENKYLAYRITFDLHDFTIQYTETHPDVMQATQVSCIGTYSFFDLNPYDLRTTKRRNDLYPRTTAFFWKNLVSNTLKEAKFKLYSKGKELKPTEYFTVDSLSLQHTINLNAVTHISRSYEGLRGSIYGVLRVVQNNKFSSDIVFMTHSFSVDSFGNIDTIDKVVFFGDMGDQRLGDMLPMNYK